MIKNSIPYVLLVGLLVLTLCTKGNQESSAEQQNEIETIDSLASELESEVDSIASETMENEKAINDLLEDI